MSKRPVGAITFDLWDCMFIDDSDEPKRAAAGVAPKPVERRELVWKYLNRHGAIDREKVNNGYDVVDAAFRKVWYDQHVTWTVRERLTVLLNGLKRTLPEAEMDELVKLHEEMELRFSPDPVPGILQALKDLKAKGYKLSVISDAIFTPGRALRQLLDKEGLLEQFDYCVFSDEIGFSKPLPVVYEAVAKQFGIDVSSIVHLGDRAHTDIHGAHNVGARGILVTMAKNRGPEDSNPDAVCDDYSKLVEIIEAMDAK